MQPNTPAPVAPAAAPQVSPPPQPQAPFPAPSLFPVRVQQEVKSLEADISKDWKSPAFWFHLAIQVSLWTGFVAVQTNSIRIGTLTVSAVSLIAYLTHLAAVNKM